MNGFQYQSSFYKPKTYKDMEEKTLFKLARAKQNRYCLHQM